MTSCFAGDDLKVQNRNLPAQPRRVKGLGLSSGDPETLKISLRSEESLPALNDFNSWSRGIYREQGCVSGRIASKTISCRDDSPTGFQPRYLFSNDIQQDLAEPSNHGTVLGYDEGEKEETVRAV